MTENQGSATHEKERKGGGGISIRIIGAVTIVIAIALAFGAFAIAASLTEIGSSTEQGEMNFVACREAVDDLQNASDYLTSQVRSFVVTGREENMQSYMEELDVGKHRQSAVSTLKSGISGDQEAIASLEKALALSNKLSRTELAAMKLAADYYGIKDVPDKVARADIRGIDTGGTQEGKLKAAQELVFGDSYEEVKESIWANVEASSTVLLEHLDAEVDANNAMLQSLLFQLRIVVALLLCTVMVLVLVLFMYILKPLSRYIKRIQKNEPLEADGAYELHYLANAYNAMYEDNSKRLEQLREFAERDPLTGISNRNGYNSFLEKHTRNIALLLIDIDHFKEFNKVYGRDTGDAVMVKVAGALSTAFRSTDFPCRLESDRFAVVMTNMGAGLRDAVSSKIELVNTILADESDDVPLVTISVGAAFSAEGMDDNDIYAAASDALRAAKDIGNNTIVFYGEHNIAEQQ